LKQKYSSYLIEINDMECGTIILNKGKLLF